MNKHGGRTAQKHNAFAETFELVGWSLTTLSTQFRPYHVFKVELYYKY